MDYQKTENVNEVINDYLHMLRHNTEIKNQFGIEEACRGIDRCLNKLGWLGVDFKNDR